MGETVSAGITAFLAAVTSIFTQAITWMGQVASTVMSTPILLVFAALPLVYMGVRLFRKLLRV